MKRYLLICYFMVVTSACFADNLEGSERLLCSATKIMVCFEDGECAETFAWETNVPQFVVIDTEKMTLATTKASGENRMTPIRTLYKEDGKIFLQGVEAGRAFSYLIDEATGLATVSVATDGLAVSVFGACTDTDI